MSVVTDLLEEESKEKLQYGETLYQLDVHRNFEGLCRGEQYLVS